MTLSYSYFNFISEPDSSHSGAGVNAFEEQAPLHRAYLKSQHNINDTLQLDMLVKHFGEMPNDDIDAYTDIDINIRWLASEQLTLSLAGANIVEASRVEFQDTIQGPFRTEVERSIFASIEYQF